MEWLNLHTSWLDSEPMLDATKEQRGVWIFLERYCAGQENSGRIPGARRWDTQKWMRNVRVDKTDVEAESPLWMWEKDDLLVEFYPLAQERKVTVGRASGGLGGRPKKDASNPSDNPPSNPSDNPPNNRKGREGKVKEGNERETARARAESLSLDEVLKFSDSKKIGRDCAEKWLAEFKKTGGLDKHQNPIESWPAALEAYAVSWRLNEHRHGGNPQAAKDLAQLEAELQGEKNAGRRRELREQIKKLRGEG